MNRHFDNLTMYPDCQRQPKAIALSEAGSRTPGAEAVF